MGYKELDEYLASGSPRKNIIAKMLFSIWHILGVKGFEERYKVARFYYYKKPFNKEDFGEEILAFTDNSIIRTRPLYHEERPKTIELTVFNKNDIHKTILKISQ